MEGARYLRTFMDPKSEVAPNRFMGLRSFLAELAGVGKVLFGEAGIIRKGEHGVVNVGNIVYPRRPYKT
ncbi:hypothetical protein [Thermococcus sp. 21S7]|uniref:hypothetical protein n=1 Tax=Thermococcus sp. 21S7 TaxID=1638221 RepID=UPI001438E512|nr:hypothetical protein [Thermococcus sp. 21S7]NJE61517.1 hypothetical protein [Thermococcus sp. 21S7]